MIQDELKLCINCTHYASMNIYRDITLNHICTDNRHEDTCPITGRVYLKEIASTCKFQRNSKDINDCGKVAQFFKTKASLD